MARPQKCRTICSEPDYTSFNPQGILSSQNIILTLDEYEAIRLIDLEKLTHEQCSKQMNISRTTVTEIYESARHKIAESLVNGKSLIISGGNYKLCNGTENPYCQNKFCCKKNTFIPTKELNKFKQKGEIDMRIAVTYDNGNIFQHFGHTEQFKLYDITDNKITATNIVSTNGSGHGALAGFLKELAVDTLICGGIGGGAVNALAQIGVKLYGGISGKCDDAVEKLINGTLVQNSEVHCSGHGHEHHHEHNCSENKNGCVGHSCH